MILLTFDNFVSDGTFGMQSLKYEKAEFMLCVRRRSFLLAVVRLFTTRTNGTGAKFVDDVP